MWSSLFVALLLTAAFVSCAPSPAYSSVDCSLENIYGSHFIGMEIPLKDNLRSCLFRNVCIDKSQFGHGDINKTADVHQIRSYSNPLNISFFLNPESTESILESDNLLVGNCRGMQKATTHTRTKVDHCLYAKPIATQKRPLAQDTYHYHNPVVLTAYPQLACENFGHALYDTIIGMYSSGCMFDLDINDLQLLSVNALGEGCKLGHKMAELISDHPFHALDTHEENHICFDSLLLPSSLDMVNFNDHFALQTIIKGFRAHVITKFFGAEATLEPIAQHSIVMSYKSPSSHAVNGRILMNIAKVNETFVERFGSRDFRVIQFQDYSMRDQLDIIRKTTVFISPNGGASMIGFFLPKNAVFVEIDVYHHVFGYSLPYGGRDMNIFGSIPFLKIVRYHVTPLEFLKPIGRKIHKNDWVHHGNYQLNSSALLQFVELQNDRIVKFRFPQLPLP
jgi:hypothetical protein